jgi:transmembrane sensor
VAAGALVSNESVLDSGTLRRYREAGEWLLRLKGSDPAEGDVERWLSWCEADEENVAAFEQLQHDWHDLEGLREAPELIVPTARRDRAHGHGFLGSMRLRHPAGRLGWAVAAALVVVAIIGYQQWSKWPQGPQTIAAAKQEPTTLPDGSSLLLSAKAAADVDFTGVDRNVALRPDGEAYIKVHHDKARPFIVQAGAVTVTAVGTAFDVRRDTGHVIVTVEEGAVQLGAPGPNGPSQWRAAAGSQVNYSEQTRTAVVSSVDPNTVMRWRYGELAYDDTPLETVIADVNRYSTVRVVMRDPEVERLRFTGTVFVVSIRDWLKALEAEYPVTARDLGDGVISLQATPSALSTPRR